jgi:hypothetical protein
MTRAPEAVSSVRGAGARSAGSSFVRSRAFAVLARAGFVARGLVYGIVGLLAFDLAVGHGGKITNQQGAMRTLEHEPLGHVLLVLLAVGLGGYALWRIVRAILGHGPEGADHGVERLGALGSGLVYAGLFAIAVALLVGSRSSRSSGAKHTTSGVFGWPGGRWLVGAAGLVMIGVAVFQLVRGLGRKFLDDSKTEEMHPATKAFVTWFGTVGHVARAVVFALVGVFLIKAAVEYKANAAVGLDGALAKLYDEAYGPWLLGAVAAGLVAFAVFSLSEARYRRI